MDLAIFIGSVLLSLVFLGSGLMKVNDSKGTTEAARQLGIPAVVSRLVGLSLPWLEIFLGVTLLIPGIDEWSAIAISFLLLVFTALAVVSLIKGKHPNCRCFGQFSSGPITWWTVARNACFETVALFLIVAGPAGAGEISNWRWLDSTAAVARVAMVSGLVLIVMTFAVGFFVVQLIAQRGRILGRLDTLERGQRFATVQEPSTSRPGLPVGSAAPSFTANSLDGERVSLESFLSAGLPVFLTFIDSGCAPCSALLPELGRWQQQLQERFTFVTMIGGSRDYATQAVEAHGLSRAVLQEDRTLMDALEIYGTPSSVLITSDGMVGSSAAFGGEEIRQLAYNDAAPRTDLFAPAKHSHRNNHQNPQNSVAQFGDHVPEITLPQFDADETLSLHGSRARTTVLLFWNPGCGFCQQMTTRLKDWESDRPKGAPDLIIITTGDVEAYRSMGLQSLALIDNGFVSGRALGVTGTPSAVMISASGQVHSTVMVGADAVMSLLKEQEVLDLVGGLPAGPGDA